MAHCVFRPDGALFGSGAVPSLLVRCAWVDAEEKGCHAAMKGMRMPLPSLWAAGPYERPRILLRVPAEGFELGLSGHPNLEGCVADSEVPMCAPCRSLHLSCLGSSRVAALAMQSTFCSQPASGGVHC